jgi:DNA repair exonuclease SbcCD nuclease subunit
MALDIDFSKTIVFTDLHYGMRNNSREHNASCEAFIDWMISEADAWGSKTCIFGGDWHHVRSAINISTLNYSVSGLRKLSNYFDHVVFIIGNHDLFYRDKYEIHSIPYISEFSNIHLIDKLTVIGDVAFVPWLVGDEWKAVPKCKAPYMFGHFELPKFKMNAMVEMPDHGQLNRDHFNNQKQVFSGHFHKRQSFEDRVWYIGNCFPHNYADAWDDERGMMFWEPGKTPKFKAFPDAPRYRTLTLSQVLEDPHRYIDDRTYARIVIDVDLNYEEVNFLKETFEQEIGAKEISMQVTKLDDVDIDSNATINFESVDTIVISHLQNIESNTIDNQKLIQIYQGL